MMAAATAALICCATADDVASDGRSNMLPESEEGFGDGGDQHDDVLEVLDARQGVDDWTPSQVAHWLRKEGIAPWDQTAYQAALEAHDIDGHLLLSLHPPDILRTLDEDMQEQRPGDFQRNLETLNVKLEELRQAIAQNPVDFWEYQVAHRRTAALLLCGLALAPRVTIFYMLFYQRLPLFLVVGHNGLSMLSLVLALVAPNLAVALHLSHIIKHSPLLVGGRSFPLDLTRSFPLYPRMCARACMCQDPCALGRKAAMHRRNLAVQGLWWRRTRAFFSESWPQRTARPTPR